MSNDADEDHDFTAWLGAYKGHRGWLVQSRHGTACRRSCTLHWATGWLGGGVNWALTSHGAHLLSAMTLSHGSVLVKRLHYWSGCAMMVSLKQGLPRLPQEFQSSLEWFNETALWSWDSFKGGLEAFRSHIVRKFNENVWKIIVLKFSHKGNCVNHFLVSINCAFKEFLFYLQWPSIPWMQMPQSVPCPIFPLPWTRLELSIGPG